MGKGLGGVSKGWDLEPKMRDQPRASAETKAKKVKGDRLQVPLWLRRYGAVMAKTDQGYK